MTTAKRGSSLRLPILVATLFSLPPAAVTLRLIFWRSGVLNDFTSYWGAARVFLLHANPYTVEPLLKVQKAVGWPQALPIPAFNPPWALPLIAPLGWLPYGAAHALWLALTLAIEAAAGLLLWSYFGGAARTRWIALAVVFTFWPVGMTARLGQITPMIVAGWVAFLLLVRWRRWFWAGVVLLPACGIKPHLVWLVAIAVLLWSIRERRWGLPAGALAGLAASCATVWMVDPAAFRYLHTIYGDAMGQLCGVGGGLRLVFGRQHKWLQYAPCVPGAAWFAWYWRRHRSEWKWAEHFPLLLLVSMASAPYCWAADYNVALPAMIAVAARGAWRSTLTMAAWLAVQAATLAPGSHGLDAALSALWIPFWLLARREAQEETRRAEEPAALSA